MKSSLVWVIALSLAAAGGLQAAEPAKVKIDSGTVVGTTDSGVQTFKGIPYAAPPVGALRWAPPQHPAAWAGDREATKAGSQCLQNSAGGAPTANGTLVGNEDCLYLNVYAPKAAKKAPVMVWIHGGYNTAGSGSSFDGTQFAKDGVVLVTINYRLGAMGFFAHPALTKEAKPNQPLANFALMDQLEALRWVQKNASAFGGDPSNVTVFGESAGAMDIFALLGVQQSQGLFKRAIMESNIGWGTAQTEAAKEAGGVQLATSLGLTGDVTPAQLRALPFDKVMAAQNRASTTIDSRMVMESTFDAFKNGHQIKVPTLVGSNSYEASLIARTPGVTPERIAAYSDENGAGPARYIAAHQAASGQPAWLYFFSYVREAQRTTAPGAAHASEIPFVFNNFTPRPGAAPTPEPTAQDRTMGALMHSCWVAFAKTGTPKCASGPAWPQYTAVGDQLMEFAVDSGVRTNFHKGALDPIEARQMAPRATGVAAR